MYLQKYIVNLDLPPTQRWQFLSEYRQEVNELISYHLSEFEGEDLLFEGIKTYKEEIIPSDYLEEIAFIASISDFSEDEVLMVNLYYDLLKFYFGCTAFAIERQGNIFHARNMDWVSGQNNLLSKYTRIISFQRDGKTIFETIGWFGFIGALSATKLHKFSLTLNAVLSTDEPEIAMPISFLLRDVLENSQSFLEAEKKLAETKIASDCLILLSGVQEGEKVVIERTPKRCEVRESKGNYIVVTNDYKLLDNSESEGGILKDTTVSRYKSADQLLSNLETTDSNQCMDILKNPNVLMGITVQQMVFNNNTGHMLVETR